MLKKQGANVWVMGVVYNVSHLWRVGNWSRPDKYMDNIRQTPV